MNLAQPLQDTRIHNEGGSPIDTPTIGDLADLLAIVSAMELGVPVSATVKNDGVTDGCDIILRRSATFVEGVDLIEMFADFDMKPAPFALVCRETLSIRSIQDPFPLYTILNDAPNVSAAVEAVKATVAMMLRPEIAEKVEVLTDCVEADAKTVKMAFSAMVKERIWNRKGNRLAETVDSYVGRALGERGWGRRDILWFAPLCAGDPGQAARTVLDDLRLREDFDKAVPRMALEIAEWEAARRQLSETREGRLQDLRSLFYGLDRAGKSCVATFRGKSGEAAVRMGTRSMRDAVVNAGPDSVDWRCYSRSYDGPTTEKECEALDDALDDPSCGLVSITFRGKTLWEAQNGPLR